jgi:glutamate synthase domain-containing protein 2
VLFLRHVRAVLPEIADAVGHKIDVLLDGGVRRGADVVRACALGAKAVLIGRSYLWALAAAGEPGYWTFSNSIGEALTRPWRISAAHPSRHLTGRGYARCLRKANGTTCIDRRVIWTADVTGC